MPLAQLISALPTFCRLEKAFFNMCALLNGFFSVNDSVQL